MRKLRAPPLKISNLVVLAESSNILTIEEQNYA